MSAEPWVPERPTIRSLRTAVTARGDRSPDPPGGCSPRPSTLPASTRATVFGARFKLGASRGVFLEWPEGQATSRDSWLLVAAHPAAVLRSRTRSADLDKLVSDLRLAGDRL